MPWLIANWRLVAVLLTLGASFYAGWYGHGLVYAKRQEAAITARLEATNKANAAIVDFNQKWSDAYAQDDCFNKPMPADLIGLLK